MIPLAAGLIGWAAVVHLIDPVASTLWVSDAAISGAAWLVNPVVSLVLVRNDRKHRSIVVETRPQGSSAASSRWRWRPAPARVRLAPGRRRNERRHGRRRAAVEPRLARLDDDRRAVVDELERLAGE